MIPALKFTKTLLEGIPRESGDDPVRAVRIIRAAQYSPRERG